MHQMKIIIIIRWHGSLRSNHQLTTTCIQAPRHSRSKHQQLFGRCVSMQLISTFSRSDHWILLFSLTAKFECRQCNAFVLVISVVVVVVVSALFFLLFDHLSLQYRMSWQKRKLYKYIGIVSLSQLSWCLQSFIRNWTLNVFMCILFHIHHKIYEREKKKQIWLDYGASIIDGMKEVINKKQLRHKLKWARVKETERGRDEPGASVKLSPKMLPPVVLPCQRIKWNEKKQLSSNKFR